MNPRFLLTCRDSPEHVSFEILGSGTEFSELIDPDDGSIFHAGPFVMHGREWRIDEVSVTEELVRIECVLATTGPRSVVSRRRARSDS
jgi:tartrate dehydratase beta subunit/fumarate hydratase class I family protein